MRYCFFIVLSLIASSCFSLNYEIQPPEQDVTLLSEYLSSLGIAKAKIKSKCKDDNCQYWLKIGNRKVSVDEKTSLIGQSRFLNNTFAIIENDDEVIISDATRYGNVVSRKKVARCLKGSNLAVGTTNRGKPLCINSEYLYAGKQTVKLPVEAVYATIGTSYRGYWQAAFVGEDYNVYVGNHQGFHQVSTGLHNQSDLKDILHIFPLSPTNSLLSIYIYDNKRNKSLMLYRLSNLHGKTEVKQEVIPVINSIESDAGLNPEVYVDTQANIIVTSTARTGEYQYKIKTQSFNNKKGFDNPYQGQDMLNLLIGASVRHTTWSVDQEVKSPDSDESSLSKTQYTMNQSLLKEVSLQGKFMGNPVALRFAKSEAEKGLGDIEKAAADRVYGYIGINDIFTGASTLRLEFRKESVGGIAEWEDESNTITTTSFVNDYTQYSILKTEEQGIYKGISYTTSNLPMAVAFFDSSKSGGQVFFDPDLEIKKLSFSYGYDEAQYTSRYLFDYRNFYFSPRVNIGLFQYSINKDIIDQAEAYFDKKYQSKAGLAIDGTLEIGYIIQKRSVDWGGAGVSFQVGLSADADFYINSIGEDTEVDDDEIIASFNRTDYRYGPFLRFNVIF